jgi:hypothetical protein
MLAVTGSVVCTAVEEAKQGEDKTKGRPRRPFEFAEITYWCAVGASGVVLVKGGAIG